MCRLSGNMKTSISWNPLGLSRPVLGLLYFLHFKAAVGCIYEETVRSLCRHGTTHHYTIYTITRHLCTHGTTHYYTIYTITRHLCTHGTTHYYTIYIITHNTTIPTAIVGCPSEILHFVTHSLHVVELRNNQRHGLCLPDMVCTYQIRCALTRYGVHLPDTVCIYQKQCALTRHGVHLPDTMCIYQIQCELTRHSVQLPDTVCTYQTRCELIRYGVHLPDTV
jgi:hypothetical protein